MSNLVADRATTENTTAGAQLRAIKVLLPVWGASYVKQFLEYTLPTLVAPGNLPALAQALPCNLEILTTADSEPIIRSHPGFARLNEIVVTSFRRIDHLVTAGNHSTTITLAYVEAVRACGKEMLDTCFIFLVSDYIVADGSLKSVLAKIQAGNNAVLVGNFQISRETASTWLNDRLRQGSKSLVLGSRELMRLALKHLHPVTLASTVNNQLSHNTRANRLFWRVDRSTVLGRFYLMHMIAIRPEVVDFEISGPCDYSFVPEMCPSGNVARIGDSDEYLVVEMQPERHESAYLRPGPMDVAGFVNNLNEWTTAEHRSNVRHNIVFHADEPPASISGDIATADKFVGEVARRLSTRPQPHRLHPYWLQAHATFKEARGFRLSAEEQFWLDRSRVDCSRLLMRLGRVALGAPPMVRFWHPRWPDYRNVMQQIEPYLRDPTKTILSASDVASPFTMMLAECGERFTRMAISTLLQKELAYLPSSVGKFDLCLVEVHQRDLWRASIWLDKLVPLMKAGGQILIASTCDLSNPYVRDQLAYQAAEILRSSVWVDDVSMVPLVPARSFLLAGVNVLASTAVRNPLVGIPAAAILAPPLIIASAVVNVAIARRPKRFLRGGRASTFTLSVRVDSNNLSQNDSNAPKDGAEQNRPLVAAPAGTGLEPRTGDSTREPQYNRCLEIRDELGLAHLGLMTNQVWYEDPRRLTIILARYKFVAKMLSGRAHVGEVGCGDSFGTRIVLQEVDRVTAYDFDPIFVEDAGSQQSRDWQYAVCLHDILSGPLPQKHDALYSLDVLEHINQVDEDMYLSNLCASLDDHGVLIIGTPSRESQTHASPQSKAGHVNCKSGAELKALLQQYFHSVFVFSMNDEVVHTGFYPMAHYLFAVCSHKK